MTPFLILIATASIGIFALPIQVKGLSNSLQDRLNHLLGKLKIYEVAFDQIQSVTLFVDHAENDKFVSAKGAINRSSKSFSKINSEFSRDFDKAIQQHRVFFVIGLNAGGLALFNTIRSFSSIGEISINPTFAKSCLCFLSIFAIFHCILATLLYVKNSFRLRARFHLYFYGLVVFAVYFLLKNSDFGLLEHNCLNALLVSSGFLLVCYAYAWQSSYGNSNRKIIELAENISQHDSALDGWYEKAERKLEDFVNPG